MTTHMTTLSLPIIGVLSADELRLSSGSLGSIRGGDPVRRRPVRCT